MTPADYYKTHTSRSYTLSVKKQGNCNDQTGGEGGFITSPSPPYITDSVP